jgi:DNA-binding GntR family transcriptional regulator
MGVIFPKEDKASGALAITHAERTLRRQILEGFYLPGQKISDSAISKDLGVSRTSVRESFQRLVQDGLITIVPNRGAFVTERDKQEVSELYELREALEVFAVSQATLRASTEKLIAIKEMLTITKTSMVEHGGRYPVELDFHATVCELAGNQALLDEIQKVHHKLKLTRIFSGYKPARARDAYWEHLSILEAMIRRDSNAAAEAMRSHLCNSRISTEEINQDLKHDTTSTEQSLLSR